MKVKIEMQQRIEDLIKKHIKLYPNRHKKDVENSLAFNKGCIKRLSLAYIETFNELPYTKISSLNPSYNALTDINDWLGKDYSKIE